ncbi:hypothetical protein WMY93_012596 [Mugilogobius chulae]|uniref:C-type lectin domain-containing protein n=1 Tax=Mugilogobius chulae TaxID=88201 RepID=A0AAW0P1B9_9GOBI
MYMDFISLGVIFFPVPQTHPVWIGLHSDGEAWKWSNGASSDYRKWAGGESVQTQVRSSARTPVWSSLAVSIWTMSVENCSEAFPFLCSANEVVQLEKMSWEQALKACRNISSKHRLLSGTASELGYVFNEIQQNIKVWVGLRFLGGSWFWSDGGAVSLSLPECPQSGLHCGAVVLRTFGSGVVPVEPSDCSEKMDVLCYREPSV